MRIGSEQQPIRPTAQPERPGIVSAEEQIRAENKDTEGQKSDPFAPIDSVQLSKRGLSAAEDDDLLNLDNESKKLLLEMQAREREVAADAAQRAAEAEREIAAERRDGESTDNTDTEAPDEQSINIDLFV